MGTRIRQQKRGKGGPSYKTKRKAFCIKIGYPNEQGEGKIIRLFSLAAFTAPIAEIKINNKKFYTLAPGNVFEGQKIQMGDSAEVKVGNILPLEKIPSGIRIFNIESNAGDGGKIVRTGGSSAQLLKRNEKGVIILLPSKREKLFNKKVRATIGIIAGAGRKEKPFLKAGRKWHLMKAKGKHYPSTSPIKMNANAHPFGSGRGKRVKPKIAKRNSPPGRKVGLLKPRRTGRKKH